MLHHLAFSLERRPLFNTWEEGVELWTRAAAAAPGLAALVVMPDHLHLLHPTDVHLPLGQALSGWVRWRHARRGETGAVFAPSPPPQRVDGPKHIARMIRYIALNPCRSRLVFDPLAWPLSSYRDAVGLSLAPVCAPRRDPRAFHAWVSSDPSCLVDGTPWPSGLIGRASADSLAEAVLALHRASPDALRRRGPIRGSFLRAARALGPTDTARVVDLAACSKVAFYETQQGLSPATRVVASVVDDPRFRALLSGPWDSPQSRRRLRGQA